MPSQHNIIITRPLLIPTTTKDTRQSNWAPTGCWRGEERPTEIQLCECARKSGIQSGFSRCLLRKDQELNLANSGWVTRIPSRPLTSELYYGEKNKGDINNPITTATRPRWVDKELGSSEDLSLPLSLRSWCNSPNSHRHWWRTEQQERVEKSDKWRPSSLPQKKRKEKRIGGESRGTLEKVEGRKNNIPPNHEKKEQGGKKS